MAAGGLTFASVTSEERSLQLAYLNGRLRNSVGDAGGTLQRLLSTFSALSRPPYHPGLFKAPLNAFVAEERTLEDLEPIELYEPPEWLLRTPRSGERASGGGPGCELLPTPRLQLIRSTAP